jgi:hypothetical protein
MLLAPTATGQRYPKPKTNKVPKNKKRHLAFTEGKTVARKGCLAQRHLLRKIR